MKRRIGVFLSGCGALDGSDVHEAVFALLAIQRAGHEAVALALDRPLMHCVNHASGQEEEGQTRSQFAEAARLSRGKVYTPAELSPKLLDGLVLVGGQGALKNWLKDFGAGPVLCDPELEAFVKECHEAGGVIGAISLAEFAVSAVLGPWPEGKGCLDLGAAGVLVDAGGRKVLTPGHTLASNLAELYQGIEALVAEMLTLILGSNEP